MKSIYSTIIGLMFCITLLAQEPVSEKFTVPLTRPGDRVSLKLDHLNGDIVISAYGGKEVIITATAKGGSLHDHDHDCDDCGDKSEIPAGMKKISANPLEMRVRENDNQIKIDSESWKLRMDIAIQMPANADLDLHTVHGEIQIDGINGAMEVSSVNGPIELRNVSGSIVSNTVNGRVLVLLKEVTSGEPMSFVTLNGDVDVTLPAKVKATAKMRSDRGEIYTDFDMSLESSKTDVTNKGGQYEVSINQWVYGKINGGGAEYTFKNMNGNIILRKGS